MKTLIITIILALTINSFAIEKAKLAPYESRKPVITREATTTRTHHPFFNPKNAPVIDRSQYTPTVTMGPYRPITQIVTPQRTATGWAVSRSYVYRRTIVTTTTTTKK